MSKTLPGRTACGAPEFDGKALSLKRYWEDIEEVVETCDRQTDAERDENRLPIYGPERRAPLERSPARRWKPDDLGQFQKEVEKLYPGSDRSAIFSLNDLDAFISTGVSKRITSKDDFAEYCRKFRTITDHLVREGRMSELESKKMFPKGLHEDFQASIIRPMEILKPAHPSGMPREIEDMIEAGRYILDALESEVSKSVDTVFIKKEMVELSDTIAKMNQRYHVDMQTLMQAPWLSRPFCRGHDTHRKDGERTKGHKAQETTVILSSREAFRRANRGRLEMDPEEAPCSAQDEYGSVWVQEKPKKGKPEVVIQKKGPPRGAQKTVDEPQQQQNEPKKPVKPTPPPGDARSHPPQPPAFKYQALVENPALVKRVLERALAAEVTITNEELCALAPEIRKWYRDNTATKIIPTVETGTYMEQEALVMNYDGVGRTRSMLLTASPIDSLHVLDFFVNNAHSVTCTLTFFNA
ncbi:hypothetical protein DFH08DRAFT_978627 [Mycena albidolilacea]|uniref:Uncharacterized protein n=1 Tax=Mycena albidolilacea TaxID=1033008 RepID=A0AAD6YYY9_9AGAR|nr:hypothetical protein DFH08DRAFT_978627 [Mycena albidolilacea]